jgi:DNA-nicking Smr family endonuclease
MDISPVAPHSNSSDNVTTVDVYGSSCYLAAACVSNYSNSSTSSGMAGAALPGSSSDCAMMDIDTADLLQSDGAAYQQGIPSSSLAAAAAAAATDADLQLMMQEVSAVAANAGVDLPGLLDLCSQVPLVSLQCAAQIYQRCMSDVDAAAAACRLGVGGMFSATSSSPGGCLVEFESIVTCVAIGDELDGVTSSAVALAKAESLHLKANAAFEAAQQCERAAAGCCSHFDKKDLELSQKAACAKAASLRAEAHAAEFAAYNSTLQAWKLSLCGLHANDACSIFAAQLQHIVSLEHPGGVLLSVVTGLACNDSIEQTVLLEQRLLSCIIEQGGIACPDPAGFCSRAGRVGNVVVAFLRPDPSSQFVVASCIETAAAAAAAAAANQAELLQAVADVNANAAQRCYAEGNMSAAANFRSLAEDNTRAARAAAAQHRALMYIAINSSFDNHWRIDLHGQSGATAKSKVQQQLLILKSMGHPGGITYTIITGSGKHSMNQIAKVRPAVLKLLSEGVHREFHSDEGHAYTLSYTESDGDNDGVVVVSIAVKHGAAGSTAARWP